MLWPGPAHLRSLRLLAALGFGLLLLAAAVAAAGEQTRFVATAAVPGRIFFGRGGDIWVLEAGRLSPVTRDGGWRQPHASPDGSRIAAVSMYDNASEVVLLDSDGSNAQQLTRNRQRRVMDNLWAFYPRWSPDGQAIGYLTDRTSFYPMLWRMNPDGTEARQLTFPKQSNDAIDTFAWSPDGDQVAVTRFLGARSQIHLVDLAVPGSSWMLVATDGGTFDPAWSPGGAHVAYMIRENGRTALAVIPVEVGEGGVVLAEAELARSPEWSPTGNSIAYLGLTAGAFEIFVLDVWTDGAGGLGASRPLQLTVQFGVDAISGLSWVP